MDTPIPLLQPEIEALNPHIDWPTIHAYQKAKGELISKGVKHDGPVTYPDYCPPLGRRIPPVSELKASQYRPTFI